MCSSYEEEIHHSSPSSPMCLSTMLLSSFWASTLISSVDPPDSDPTPSFVASVDIAAAATDIAAAVVDVVVGGNSSLLRLPRAAAAAARSESDSC